MTDTGKPIAMDLIKKLIKQEDAKQQVDPFTGGYKERWPGDANVLKIAKAVRRGADFVLFTNGTRFRIITKSPELVLVKPDSGFVPMGFFNVKTLRDAELQHGT